MTGWEFRDPLFLLVGLFAPVWVWLGLRSTSRLTYSSLDLMDEMPQTLRARLANLPAVLLGLSCFLLAIALAGPRTGDSTTEVHREGIAITLVVDVSGSMDARDFVRGNMGVSRLDAVKEIIARFVTGGEGLSGRPDDLISLVVFARYADAICPLTLDHLNLSQILADVTINRDPDEQGTAVGEGLALAVERLRGHEAESKILILLTDGVNNAGEIDPMQAAKLAAAHDMRVYAIGAGRTGLAPVPVQTRDGRTVLQRVRVELDEKSLQAIAHETGGRYFHATNAKALAQVYAEIDRLERTEITEIKYLQYTEHYAAWVVGALASMALSGLLAGTFLRRFS